MKSRFASAALLLLYMSFSAATLVIYHGRVTNEGVRILRVEGVTSLVFSNSHFFDCDRVGGPSSNLQWKVNGSLPRFTSSGMELPIDGNNIQVWRLNLDPVSQEPAGADDVGTYTCADTLSGETLSIAVNGPVAICAVDPNQAVCVSEFNIEVIIGSTAQLQVYADGDPFSSPPDIIWTPPDTSNRSRSSLQDGNRRMVIEGVALEDSGAYRVEIVQTIDGLEHRAFTVINLDVHVGVMVVSSPVSTPVLEHASVTFTCVFRGNPPPTITWEREGSDDLPVVTRREITSSENEALFTVTSEFTISNVLYEDQGRYQCVAANTLTGEVLQAASSAPAELTVTPRLQLAVQDTSDTILENGLASVNTGSKVVIQCSGSGDLLWESSTVAIQVTNDVNPSTNVFQRHDQTSSVQNLIIQAFAPASDTGFYTCRRTDLIVNGNSITESVYVTSSDPAIFIAEETIYALEGSSAEIRATVYSSDLNSLVIGWYYEDSLITTSDPGYSVSAEGMSLRTLSIASVGVDTLGTYQAVVTVGDRNHSDTVRLALTGMAITSSPPLTTDVTTHPPVTTTTPPTTPSADTNIPDTGEQSSVTTSTPATTSALSSVIIAVSVVVSVVVALFVCGITVAVVVAVLCHRHSTCNFSPKLPPADLELTVIK